MRLDRHVSEMSIMELIALREEIESRFKVAKRTTSVLEDRLYEYARFSDHNKRVVNKIKSNEPDVGQFGSINPESYKTTLEAHNKMMKFKKEATDMDTAQKNLDSILKQYINQLIP